MPEAALGGADKGALRCKQLSQQGAALKALLLQGKKLVFVTNNSTKSRKGYLGKFTGLGLNVSAEEIYSSSYAAAAYLESIDFPNDKKVQTSTATPEQPKQDEPVHPCCATLDGLQGQPSQHSLWE